MNETARLIDFHSHILPGTDHGSGGIEEGRRQMSLIQGYGVDTVVATPHFYPERHKVDDLLGRIDRAVELLKNEGLPFASRLCLGAEVLYCDHIDKMEELDRLCVRGTNVLLLEMSMDRWSDGVFETVETLLGRYTVVLAHIDRYLRTQSGEIDTLLQMGALAQVNASSLFSFGSRRKLAPFLDSGAVVALGSDLHGADKKAYEAFANAEKKLGSLHGEILSRSAELLRTADNFL
jgi:protein-tyrosine phosphatase